jgi:hypothetical protein
MLDMLFLIGIGVIIGWHVPMPPWAKWAIDFVKSKVQSWLAKK